MTQRYFRVRLTPLAARQIVDQSDYYLGKSGAILATRWRKAVQEARSSLGLMPDRGEPCHFRSKAIQAVRRIEIPGFSRHSLFYRSDDSTRVVTILSILHVSRDIEAILTAAYP